MNTTDIASIKSVYRIPAAWRDLGLPGEPGPVCRSPFPGEHKHGDRNPSFSLFADGVRWKDHATGQGGDVIDLVAKVRGGGAADAVRWVRERLGIAAPSPMPRMPSERPQKPLPSLRLGTDAEIETLAVLRGFHPDAVAEAQARGFLRFTRQWGHAAWAVTDRRRRLIELRRLDGQPWPAFGRLAERKGHAVGVGKDWPLGVLEAERYPAVAFVEGAPDFLAVLDRGLSEGRLDDVAPVGVLGAANLRLSPEALAHLAGKHVCLFPHLDDAGQRACREWALQIKAAGARRVTAFDLSGLTLRDGKPGKDLADVSLISPDCLARESKFRRVLP